MSALRLLNLRPLSRTLSTSSSTMMAKAPKMSQVEVDEPEVQKRLGKIQMDFVKKAERTNEERAKRHKHFRRGDFIIASKCNMVSNMFFASG